MAKRVFELARELGVTSKAVLDKCRAEGIDLKNHMAALSAGLEATIHEWFSEGAAVTAIETSEHVNLDTAREQAATERRRRHREGEPFDLTGEPGYKAEEGAPEFEEAHAPVVEAGEPQVAEEPVTAAETPTEAPVAPAPAPEPDVVAQPEAAAAPVETVQPAPAPVAEAPAAGAPAEVVEVPKPPEKPAPVLHKTHAAPQAHASASQTPPAAKPPTAKPSGVMPAGPQVVPRPAKLTGPRVVRFDGVDASETFRRPPPRMSRPGPGPAGIGPTPVPTVGPGGKPKQFTSGEEDEEGKKKAKKRSPRRRGSRAVETPPEGLREWRDADLVERSERLAAATGGALRRHRAQVGQMKKDGRPVKNEIEVDEPVTIKSLSAATGVKSSDFMRKLMSQGTLMTINQVLTHEVVEQLALEFNLELRIKVAKTAESALEESLAKHQRGELLPRAPIVTFLGHVDHGKTSLLDKIRNASVASTEEGGITQHIGAYRYDVAGKHVVFLDTPGHEAFTAMRARGANMTDVVVLVVAADDGVMPQTQEAINHAKAAKVPIVVALNKVDLPNANIQRALGQLSEFGLNPRQWGGNTEVIETSATTGQGIPELVETLSLEAELLELKADPTAPASGWVMESRLDPSRGVLARMLVRDGTMRVGDVVLCGSSYGRVRSMLDSWGKPIQEAAPATPVEVAGMDSLPEAGERFMIVGDFGKAREVAEDRRQKARQSQRTIAPQATLQNLLAQIESGKATELNVVLKCDVHGSLEALQKTLAPLSNNEVRLNVLHAAVGGISEGDVLLAEASHAIILGFRVLADQRSRILADQKGVEIRNYMVIYHLVEDLEKALKSLLAPEKSEKVLGHATVREVFKVSRVGSIAGCMVSDGTIARNSKIRIVRDNVVVEDGRQLESLRRFKDDVRDVRAGLECGLKVSGYDDIKVGDVLESYLSVEIART